MSHLAVIVQTEFLRRVRSRPYLIGTFFGAVGLALIALLPGIMANSVGASSRSIVLAGPPALVAPAATLLAKDFDVVATAVAPPAAPSQAYLDAHGKASALVVIARGRAGLHVTVFARDAGAGRDALGHDLVPLNVALSTNVPQSRIRALLDVSVDTESLDAKFADGAGAEAAKGIGLAMVTILYLAIILNAQNVLASVAEEKTSRIAELLVATVRPSTLLTGKILATAASGALQIAVWIAAACAIAPRLATQYGAPSSSGANDALFSLIERIGPAVVAAFAVFFVIGFLQFALMYASAGALISRTEDLGSVMAPLVLPVVAGFLIAQVAVVAPLGANVVVLSMVPLVSPFVMFARIAVATIPLWQVALSIAINVAAIVVTAIFAGKLYRVGLLSYGRPPTFSQVWAVLRS